MRKGGKNLIFSKFPRCPIFNFFVVTREVICQKMAPILDPVNFFWVFSLLSHCVSDLATWSHLLHGFLCAFSMWRRLTILNLVLEVALFALKTNLVFFLYVVPHFLPCFPVNSHREHCTRGIIFASGHVLPFFAKRTEEARGR